MVTPRDELRDHYEKQGKRLSAALFEDIDSTSISDEDLGDRVDMDKAQISRCRQGKAHAPDRLRAWAIDNTRNKPPRYLEVACEIGEYEPKPRPPPDVSERYGAWIEVAEEMGIDEVMREKVDRKLKVASRPPFATEEQ